MTATSLLHGFLSLRQPMEETFDHMLVGWVIPWMLISVGIYLGALIYQWASE